jgi:probable rRNA maturation factor
MATRNRLLFEAQAGGAVGAQAVARLQRLAHRFLRQLKLEGVELSLTLVGDRRIRTVNRQWRQKDRPTDVLSFPAGDFPGPGLKPLGDLMISLDTARRAARAFGTTVDEELAFYLAHGLLHLLGHDHQTRREARAMKALEDGLLGHEGMLARSDEV